MKAILALVAALFVSVATVSPARSSEEWSFEVFQPIWTDNEITLSRVTVLTFNSGDVGELAVIATCDSSHVMSDYGPQQRNAGFEVGLRTEVTFNSGSQSSLFGDTLRVILRGTKPPAGLGDFSYDTIVAATVQCILANAATSLAIKVVALRVEAGQPCRRYGGVFRTARFRNGPTKREFRG